MEKRCKNVTRNVFTRCYTSTEVGPRSKWRKPHNTWMEQEQRGRFCFAHQRAESKGVSLITCDLQISVVFSQRADLFR